MSNAKELGKQEHSGSDSSERATTENAVKGQAEGQPQQTTSTKNNSLEKYCEENPGASQCRIYDE